MVYDLCRKGKLVPDLTRDFGSREGQLKDLLDKHKKSTAEVQLSQVRLKKLDYLFFHILSADSILDMYPL